MKNQIKVGPIKKRKPTATVYNTVRKQIKQLKSGEFFEISGVSSKSTAMNIRAAISYYSKHDRVKVETSKSGSVLTVQRSQN